MGWQESIRSQEPSDKDVDKLLTSVLDDLREFGLISDDDPVLARLEQIYEALLNVEDIHIDGRNGKITLIAASEESTEGRAIHLENEKFAKPVFFAALSVTVNGQPFTIERFSTRLEKLRPDLKMTPGEAKILVNQVLHQMILSLSLIRRRVSESTSGASKSRIPPEQNVN